MTGSGGWPMTVFMTPEGEPFFCGTYFPPERRGGHPAFREILDAVQDTWTNRRGDLLAQAEQLTEGLRRTVGGTDGSDLPDVAVLDEATMSMMAAHDGQWGGFGRAPKFPQAMSLGHLLRHQLRTGSESVAGAVITSLDAMASGGMYDQIGGGFSRYSVDERWLVPHFEKMLYDNALLIRAYTHGAQVTGLERYAQIATETIGYVLNDLSHPEGGRYSAEDADSLATPRCRPRPRGGVLRLDAGRGRRGPHRGGTGRAHRLRVWVLRHHRGGQLRGRLDPQPAARPRRVRSTSRDRGRPSGPAGGPGRTPTAGPGRQGADGVERPIHRRTGGGRVRHRAGGLGRRGDQHGRVPDRAPQAPRRPLAAVLAGRRRGPAPGVLVGLRRPARRVPLPVRGHGPAPLVGREPHGRRRPDRPVLGSHRRRVQHRRRCREPDHPAQAS